MSEPRSLSVTSPDGDFTLHLWTPERDEPGPAIVLLQEIFGVSDYIQEVAQQLADMGYVVGAPDLFWRLQPNWVAGHDEQGLNDSLALAGRFDFAKGVEDAGLAMAALADLDECDGRVGIFGFCLGGAIGHVLAANTDPEVLVSYYGSGVPDAIGLFDDVECPAQYVFGGSDPYISRDRVAAVEGAARGRENVVVQVFEEAGHAFHNHKAPMFHNPSAAAAAWASTEEFLAENLPVDPPDDEPEDDGKKQQHFRPRPRRGGGGRRR